MVVRLLFLLMLVGCKTSVPTYVEDPVRAPILTGMSRAETVICGRYAIGNNFCWTGNPHNLTLEVKTWFNGRVMIRSVACNLDKTFTYQNFQSVFVNLAEYIPEIKQSCIIDIIVTPEWFVNGRQYAIPGSFGRVIIGLQKSGVGLAKASGSVVNQEYFEGAIIKTVRAGNIAVGDGFSFLTNGSKTGKFRIDGCGRPPFIREYKTDTIFVAWSDLFPEFKQTNCVFYGRIVRKDMASDLSFAVILEVFADDVAMLSDPSVKVSNTQVSYVSLDPITWTTIDTDTFPGGSGVVEIQNKDFTLRQFTSKGRTIVVKVENGKVTWVK